MILLGTFGRWTLLGIAGFGMVANLLLRSDHSVPHWLFPIALLVAWIGCLGAVIRSPARARTSRSELVTLAILALVLVALAYGSLATASREWDGYVAWNLKARVLEREPTLHSAFFSAPEVDAHSRDYPLLQPLCQASLAHWLSERGGRGLFPMLWLVLVGLAARAWATIGSGNPRRCLAWLGAALMPGLVSPGGGAVDSGYAELFLCVAMTGIACGLLTKDALLVGAGVLVAGLVKPEGWPYAGALAFALVVSTRARLAIWVAALGAGALGLSWSLGHLKVSFDRLPEALLGEASHLVSVKRFGLAFLGLCAVACSPRRICGPCPSPALGWFVVGGLVMVPAPLLLWPALEVEHHIRSSMGRLLLHWAVPAWLLAVAWLDPSPRCQVGPAARCISPFPPGW